MGTDQEPHPAHDVRPSAEGHKTALALPPMAPARAPGLSLPVCSFPHKLATGSGPDAGAPSRSGMRAARPRPAVLLSVLLTTGCATRRRAHATAGLRIHRRVPSRTFREPSAVRRGPGGRCLARRSAGGVPWPEKPAICGKFLLRVWCGPVTAGGGARRVPCAVVVCHLRCSLRTLTEVSTGCSPLQIGKEGHG